MLLPVGKSKWIGKVGVHPVVEQPEVWFMVTSPFEYMRESSLILRLVRVQGGLSLCENNMTEHYYFAISFLESAAYVGLAQVQPQDRFG